MRSSLSHDSTSAPGVRMTRRPYKEERRGSLPATLGFQRTGIRESCEEFTSEKSTLTQGVPKLLFILPAEKDFIETTNYEEPVMGPGAAESVPILNVKAPDCSWISREKTVIDYLRGDRSKSYRCCVETCISWFQNPAFVSCSTRKALSTLAQDKDQE